MRYWSGFFAGVGAAAIAALAWISVRDLPDIAATLAEFQSRALPAATRLVLGSAWRAGAPLALAAALPAAHRLRGDRPRVVAIGALALAAVAAVAFTRWASALPFTELSRALAE
jgi:hypothetical protein